jgi:hypothetical protein
MATYSTDLTTIITAESGTWVELTGTILGFTLSGAGSPGVDAENFIQGTACYSQTTGKAQDAEISMVYDYGAGYTFSAGDVVFGWCYYAVGANLKTKANSGWMFVICNSLTTGDYFVIGGSDYGRNPYGGWTNVAIDPTATESGTLGGGGNGGTYRYFGQVCNTIAEITKGNPSAVDAIREGRGIISVTGSGGSFTELASYNDYNDGGTPPGTSSTSIDSGRHRLGLFQSSAGTFLWKGLLSLGTIGASVTFSDSNATIIIDDCPHTYPSFNKIEINNASSSVILNNISIISTASTANGIGNFEMVANATVVKNGCLFVDMGTFIYLSNATVLGTTFQGCNSITAGGGTFTGSKVLQSTVTGLTSASLIWDETTDPDGNLNNMEFSSGSTLHHAIYFGNTIPSSITLRGIEFSGFNLSNGQNNSTLYFADTTGTITVNLVGCVGTISYESAGATINLVADPVTTQIITKDADTQELISGVTTFAWVTDGTNFPYLDSVSITGTSTTATVHHVGHGLSTNDTIWIQGADQENYVGAYDITVINDDYYSYTTVNTIVTSPATGTITATFAFFNGLTDVNGEISDSRVISSDQPFAYRCRKSTVSPLYKAGSGTDTVDSINGKSITVNLVSDE